MPSSGEASAVRRPRGDHVHGVAEEHLAVDEAVTGAGLRVDALAAGVLVLFDAVGDDHDLLALGQVLGDGVAVHRAFGVDRLLLVAVADFDRDGEAGEARVVLASVDLAVTDQIANHNGFEHDLLPPKKGERP